MLLESLWYNRHGPIRFPHNYRFVRISPPANNNFQMTYQAVVAIDIGTAYTKVACNRYGSSSPPCIYQWLGVGSNDSWVSPTAVLYKKSVQGLSVREPKREWTMQSFGIEALEGYQAARNNSKLLLYTNFKMELHELRVRYSCLLSKVVHMSG